MITIKKIFLVLLSVLLFSNAQAQLAPVFPRLDSLRTALYLQLGEGVADTPSVHLAINLAVSKVCTDYPAIQMIDTVVVAKTDEGGALPADFNRYREYDAVWLMKGDTLRLPLVPAPPGMGVLLPTVGDNIDDKQKLVTPRYYSVWGSPPRLLLHPKYIGAAADSFIVYYYANENKLEAVSDTTVVPKDLLHKILEFAGLLISGDAGRYFDATFYQQLYDGRIEKVNNNEEK